MTVAEVARKEGLKRDVIAIAVAVAIHLLVVGAFLLSNLLFFNDVEEYRGPVLVKLGRPDAPEEVAESLPVTPVETVEEPEVIPEEPVEPAETPEEKEVGSPEETVQPQEPESDNVVERPVSEEERGDSGEKEQSSVEERGESGVAPVEAPPAEVEEAVKVTEGSDEGNAFEMTAEAKEGIVGRSLGGAISLYLPLPQIVDQSVFDKISDDPNLVNRTAEKKRGILSRYYSLINGEYILASDQPRYEARPEIWSILIEGGYDTQAYKEEELNLKGREVVITFVVDVGDRSTGISDVKFIKRTGYFEIDEAVLFGFQQAAFSNSADTPVKGRFTYRFQ